MQTLPIDSVIEYYNINTNEKVKLRIAKVKNFNCKRCWFHDIDRHCPDEYACSKYARTDNTSINFRKCK